ncbi:4Fe-4S binding protein [Actinomadura barringtoniae]|uniref:Ferredoxin n=1 Tax=Actinomadura barringtoniae TaxID=1427535 RepID=A0A939T1Z3_9ACTN|nr:4Fe-4S binding protein [Actinomadura barringtoniae]MBO2448581.1 4Fe-4S binding protein [Actinomadura barringtoniae]
MAFVITQPCENVKDGACVDVCPADCIETTEAADQYFIDPERCIDCDVCVTVCPVDAIYRDSEVPAEWDSYIAKNDAFFNGGNAS